MTMSNPRHDRQPREITGRMVFLCLVAFFGVVTAVNAVMITAAVSTFGGVETESSYKAGLSFAREASAAEAQRGRGWQVDARIHRQADGRARFELVARDAGQQLLGNLDAALVLIHPTDRRLDRKIAMTTAALGRFTGSGTPAPGQWDLLIELTRDGERLYRSRQRVILN
jgi:nitrogen fixation protein FixH